MICQRTLWGGWICLAMILIGCQRESNPSDIPPAVRRAGFTAEAVTTYYDDQGIRYLTDQLFEIEPENASMTVSSDEPEGSMQWSIREQQYAGPSTGSAKAWYDPFTTKLILTAFLAGSGLLDGSSLTPGDPVKIDGQWYYPLSLGESSFGKITVFKKQKNSVMDRVEILDSKTGDRFIGLAYNPLWNDAYGKSVITKIDLSKVTGSGSRRLIQIHFQSINYNR